MHITTFFYSTRLILMSCFWEMVVVGTRPPLVFPSWLTLEVQDLSYHNHGSSMVTLGLRQGANQWLFLILPMRNQDICGLLPQVRRIWSRTRVALGGLQRGRDKLLPLPLSEGAIPMPTRPIHASQAVQSLCPNDMSSVLPSMKVPPWRQTKEEHSYQNDYV